MAIETNYLEDLLGQRIWLNGAAEADELLPTKKRWDLFGFDAVYNAQTDRVELRVASGFDWQESVRVATTANIAAARVGNTLTASGNGSINTAGIDGVTTLALNNRVLFKDQTTGADRGLYYLTDLGSASTPWIAVRVPTADLSAEVTTGLTVYVEEGTANAESGWVLTTPAPIVLNSTVLTFENKVPANAVNGPASSTDNAIARWNGAGGNTLQNSQVLISDTADVSGANSLAIGNDPATAGGLRLANAETIQARNAANSANITALEVTTADLVQLGGTTAIVRVGAAILQVGATALAATGAIRTRNTAEVVARNAADSADVRVIGTDASDRVVVAPGNATVRVPGAVLEIGTTVASAGAIRLPNNDQAQARNAANSANIFVIGSDSSDRVLVGGSGAAAVRLRDTSNNVRFEVNATGVGFFAVAPVAQQADVGALVDNTGATPDNTIENVPAAAGDAGGIATVSAAANVATVASVNTALTAIENDVSDLTEQCNAFRTVFRNLGLMA